MAQQAATTEPTGASVSMILEMADVGKHFRYWFTSARSPAELRATALPELRRLAQLLGCPMLPAGRRPAYAPDHWRDRADLAGCAVGAAAAELAMGKGDWEALTDDQRACCAAAFTLGWRSGEALAATAWKPARLLTASAFD
jgi:hypothetical protein